MKLATGEFVRLHNGDDFFDAIECGQIEDPWEAPPEEPYTLTRVTDTSGAVVVGAAVTLLNTTTNVSYHAATGPVG